MVRDLKSGAEHEDAVTEPDEFLIEIGHRIREARQKSKLTIPELMEAVGCGKGWVYGVELGNTNFNINMFRRLLAALGLEFRDVVVRESQVSERVPNEKLHALASRAVLQLGTATQVIAEARDLNEKLRMLTEVEGGESKHPR